MKHSIKITSILIGLFVLTQLVGLGALYSITQYELAHQTQILPELIHPLAAQQSASSNLVSIIIALTVGILIMLLCMALHVERVLRFWFLAVVAIAITVTLHSFFVWFSLPVYIAIALACILALGKVFWRHILLHNITEVLIYPGIALMIVPLLSLWTTIILLGLISVYDIYAVWHAGFMQKMAKYQIQKVRVFSGFFIPYLAPHASHASLLSTKKNKGSQKKSKVGVAILGGGDVVFPLLLSFVLFLAYGILPALAVTLGATGALTFLFIVAKKGKFYPAMPFISAGCCIALIVLAGIKFLL